MKADIKQVLESIPDFEDFMELAAQIATLSFNKMQIENQIKTAEANTFKEAMSKPLENGKFPSSSFVSNAFLHTGLNGEIVQLRDALADTTANLEKRKMQFSIYKEMIGIFQTVSANERSQGF